MKRRKQKVIISIDGGGIRGIFPLLVLDHINTLIQAHQLSDDLSQSIDLIAGTSTGAIILAGLVVKKDNENLYSLEELLNLYEQRGPQLFNLATPKHEKSEGLRLLLQRKFKNIFLSDLDVHFNFVSYDIQTQQPFVFDKYSDGMNLPLSTALAACSAVPGYFSPVKIDDYHLIDGIMAAKNPSKIAYEYARKHFPNSSYLLLSFGTGLLTGEMNDEIEQEVSKVEHFLEEKVTEDKGLNYFRFQPEIKVADSRMDNASPENIAALVQDGKRYIKTHQPLFDELLMAWEEQL